jgi:hypothetical protein
VAVEGAVVICVNPDTPWKTMKDLVEAAKENKKIRMATSGVGGLPYVAGAMMKNIHGTDFNYIQFDGDGPGATAVMGGHADVMPLALSTSVEYIRAGRLRGLAVLTTKRVPQLPDLPCITEPIPNTPIPPLGPLLRRFREESGLRRCPGAKLSVAFDQRPWPNLVLRVCQELPAVFKNGCTGEEAVKFLDKFESTQLADLPTPAAQRIPCGVRHPRAEEIASETPETSDSAARFPESVRQLKGVNTV